MLLKIRTKRILGAIFLFILLIGFVLYKVYAAPMLGVLNGYAAKKACTCYFAQGKSLDQIKEIDLSFEPIDMASLDVNDSNKSMQSSVYGLAKRTAVYRGNLGCILLKGKDDYNISFEKQIGPSIERELVKQTSDNLSFLDSMAFKPEWKTEAVLVLHSDTIVYEKYSEGVDETTPLLGWSMTKSITSTLIGMLVKEGKLSLDDKGLFQEWSRDQRSTIALRQLLHMNSGLYWEEVYDQISTATNMLYNSDDMVAYVSSQALQNGPGTLWKYSSGTSNLLMELARRQFSSDLEFYDYVHDFFEELGMHSAFIEPDESGNLIGSSYGYASARDWARFGKLYLDDGFTNNKQLIDTSWVDFSRTAVDDKNPQYGGHFWLRANMDNSYELPDDLYSANGFQGQYVIIIPSHDLVLVRLGNNDAFEVERFVKSTIDALKN